MVVKKKKQILKKKKKQWFEVFAPKMFNNALLGEIYVSESSDLIGKVIKLNLSAVTRIRNNNVNILFKVSSVKEGKGYSDVIGYGMVGSYMKRVVRKNKSKVDASYSLKNKDDKAVVIKPILVTRSLITSKKLRDLRLKLDEFIKEEIEKTNSVDFIGNLVNHTFQEKMKASLSKIYPLAVAEIKSFRIK